MKVTIKAEGVEAVGRQLGAIHDSLEARRMEKVLLDEGARPIRDEWKRRAPRATGRLRASIKAKIGRRRGNWIAGAFAAIGRKRTEAPHANVLLAGAKPHVIASTTAKVLRFAGRFAAWAQHPGIKANTFTDDGLAAVQASVEENVSRGLLALIDKATK